MNSPTQVLFDLETTGVKLSVRKGVLFFSKSATQEQRALIAANKESLIAVIAYQCPRCNQPLRTRLNSVDQVSYLECPMDVSHFGERLGRLEIIRCPGDDCSEQINLADSRGWCPKHKMFVRIVE